MQGWRSVVGFEGFYEVSIFGNVRSVDRIVRKAKRLFGKNIATCVGRNGYEYVTLYRGGKGLTRTVHSLVLEAFVGERPAGFDACHENGNRLDNRLCNLRWDSRLANVADTKRHGKDARGERNGQSKLTDASVREVFRLRGEGRTHQEISAVVGVSRPVVTEVLQRKIWSHVELDSAH